MNIRHALRWALVIPAAVGAGGLVVAAGIAVLIGTIGRNDVFVFVVTDVLASALAVYVGAKVAPSRGRTVAAVLAVLAVGKEFIHGLPRLGADPFGAEAWSLTVLAVALATGLSAILFARSGRPGFSRRWMWFVTVPVALVSSTLLLTSVVGLSREREAKATGRVRDSSPQRFQGDGLSFSYPADWTLETPGWKEFGSGRTRRFTFKGAESRDNELSIVQRQPATEISIQDLTLGAADDDTMMKLLHGSERPVVVTIAGETIVGLQKDFEARVLAVKVPMRFQWFQLKRREQSVVLIVGGAIEDWPGLERRVRLVFESMQAD